MSRQRGHVELLILAIVGVMISVGVASIMLHARKEQREWAEFAREHNCKVVERKMKAVPDQVAYLCDDGVKHWRRP